jgi:uncharacterized protein YfeS
MFPNRLENRTSLTYMIAKTLCIQNKEIILTAATEKCKVTNKPIRIIPDLSKETLKVRRTWNDIFWDQKENDCQLSLLTNHSYLS